jgi:hypothetical protein
MQGKALGTLMAASVAGMLMTTGVAVAKSHHKKKDAGWCKSNECAGKVDGAKNSCNGKAACKGITKEACEKDGKGSWQMGKMPKDDGAAAPAATDAPAK